MSNVIVFCRPNAKTEKVTVQGTQSNIVCVFFFYRLSAKTQKMMKVIQMTQKLSKMRCWLSMQEKLCQIWARP
jgi:hypothetical protein